MKNIIPYEKDIEFPTKIAEITSISLEHEEKIGSEELIGDFILSGDYKIHSISVNKETFNYRIPFSIELSNLIDKTSINVDVADFTYDIKNNNTLSVKIDLYFAYEEKEIEQTEELPLEVVEDLHIDNIEEERVEQITEQDILKLIEEDNNKNIDVINSKVSKDITSNKEDKEKAQTKETIIPTGLGTENTYITYKVHVVEPNDTLEIICQKYNITKDIITEYNNFTELTSKDKLLIPIINE